MIKDARSKGIFDLVRRDMVCLYLEVGRIYELCSDMNKLKVFQRVAYYLFLREIDKSQTRRI
jgi:hypothetical protein